MAETRDADDDTGAAERPRRSVLYMPGSKERALEKAKTLTVDALIFDLEDAVAPDEKAAAREKVRAAVREAEYGRRELVIRVNGLDTPWGLDDLRAAAAAGPDAVLIPKVNAAQQVEEVAALIDRFGAPSRTRVWAMLETPRGVLHSEAIASASPRLECFVMGTNDLAKELGCEHTPGREPLLTSLSSCLLAARAYGVAIVDGVYNAFEDDEGFRAACEQSRALGFDGRTLIHPRQAPIANAVFAPDAAVLDLARRQVAAYAAALARGEAVAVVDGRIVENLHVETARRMIARAEAIAAQTAAD